MKKTFFEKIEFVQIKNYPNYYVSNCGKVLSFKKNKKLLKPENVNNYLRVTLLNSGKGKRFLVHRLVAEVFIPNLYNKPQINHIDGNPSNNSIKNLEWCTQSENQKHAIRTGLQKIKPGKEMPMYGKFSKEHNRSKKVKQLDLDGNLIKIWDSMMDIKRELNMSPGSICRCCKGYVKISNGYLWRYLE